ncbi:nitrogenase component 1 [uncultured Desulfobacter sp.]|uniref:nitrogenase component 1 n=1 Tax=uncultured Desulfobacter sp. TaxID=240139 RepID=UPI002AAB822D|nr:nitrogenase component 1 [uncultured Desulfobacter sp.]
MQKQAFWEHLNYMMFPSAFVHSFGMNGKISGCVAAIGEVTGRIVSVLHAPVGCAFHYRNSARRGHYPYFPLLCSDLTEQEIIMGGGEKLEQTVREAYIHFQPELIFIIPSPIADVLNEDFFSVVSHLKSDGIPVAVAKSELFSLPDRNYVKNLMRKRGKLKVGEDNHLEIEVLGCGFTEATYAIVEQVMEDVPRIENSVNLETIAWGIEGSQVLNEIEDFLNLCGVHVNCRIPSSPLEQLKRAPAASLNLVRYFVRWARRMKELYGTEYLHIGETTRYEGLDGIARFYSDIAQRLQKTETMEPLIALEKEKALDQTFEDREFLASKKCVLVCRGLHDTPKQIRTYAQIYGLQLNAICIILTEDMKRYYWIDEELEAQLMIRLNDAVALYAPGTQVYINPSAAALHELFAASEAIVGTNDFTMEGKGAPLVTANIDTLSFSFPSYVRSIQRMRARLQSARERNRLILNRISFDSEDFTLYPKNDHRASREMWLRMWLEKNNKDEAKECCK